MPLFMDLHIVTGLTAQGVAEAHVLDLRVQDEFQCSCMTYWIDENNNSAFCLIEAPNESAVRKLHKRSHGLLPYNIIEVNKDAVTSFLGRLYDPEVSGIAREELKVFNDPAQRTLILIDILDPILLKTRTLPKRCEQALNKYLRVIKEKVTQFGGEIAEHREQITSILCFSSSENALSCALEIADSFSLEEKEVLQLRISLNSGMPVSSSDRIFGETIDFGIRLLYVSRNHNLVVSTNIQNIAGRHLDHTGARRTSLTPGEEKLLNKIFMALEQYSADEEFGIDDLSREVGLSKSSLNRHLQTLTLRSPNTLLKEYRLNNALKILKNGDSISNAAFSSGFRSPSYFSKCFKEHFSLSPSEFADQLRSRSA